MSTHRVITALSVALGMIVLVIGCGDERPAVSSSTTEATVKGTVTVKGKLLTEGKVVFDPANYQRKDVSARSAPISKEGTYEVKTLIGLNTIRIDAPTVTKDRVLGYETVALEVKEGENILNVVLPKPGTTAPPEAK